MGLTSRIMGYGKDELISMARDEQLYDTDQFVSVHEGFLWDCLGSSTGKFTMYAFYSPLAG